MTTKEKIERTGMVVLATLQRIVGFPLFSIMGLIGALFLYLRYNFYYVLYGGQAVTYLNKPHKEAVIKALDVAMCQSFGNKLEIDGKKNAKLFVDWVSSNMYRIDECYFFNDESKSDIGYTLEKVYELFMKETYGK